MEQRASTSRAVSTCPARTTVPRAEPGRAPWAHQQHVWVVGYREVTVGLHAFRVDRGVDADAGRRRPAGFGLRRAGFGPAEAVSGPCGLLAPCQSAVSVAWPAAARLLPRQASGRAAASAIAPRWVARPSPRWSGRAAPPEQHTTRSGGDREPANHQSQVEQTRVVVLGGPAARPSVHPVRHRTRATVCAASPAVRAGTARTGPTSRVRAASGPSTTGRGARAPLASRTALTGATVSTGVGGGGTSFASSSAARGRRRCARSVTTARRWRRGHTRARSGFGGGGRAPAR